jgi:CheY-like chemotaxis protein
MSSRFLLVEDEPTLQRVMSSVLGDTGHVVEVAVTVAQAIERVTDRGQPDLDLILADKNLPDGTGLDVLSALRASGSLARFVLVTGYPNPDSALAVLNLGAEAYWSKPLRSLAVAMRQLDHINRLAMPERRRRHRLAHEVGDALRNRGPCAHTCAPLTSSTPRAWWAALTEADLASAQVLVSDGWPDDAGWALVGERPVVVVSDATPMDAVMKAIEHGATVWLSSC